MITFNGLPLYRATLAADGDGVIRVSLVDDPAVQSQFEFFSGQKAPALYAVQDEEKRIVRGVVLRADFPIFRRDKAGDAGYYVTFGADVIRKAAERFLTDGHANAVNLDHVAGSDVDGVQMVQLFIKDSAAGIDPEGFDNIADGSLFAEYHVTNDEVWNEIKAGTFKGFSVEIFYTLMPAGDTMAAQELDAEDLALLDRISEKIQNTMTLKEFFKQLAGVVLAEPEPQKFGSVTTDKGVLYWDGNEDLKAGDRVQVDDADGNRVDAADDDYTTSDGKTIVVVDGAVSEIKDPEAEVAPETPAEEKEEMRRFNAIRAAFEESYEDKERKIIEAIYAAREGDDTPWYLVEAGDDFAVIAMWDEEKGERYVRYSIAWDEDGKATASDPQDVDLVFEPADKPAEDPEAEAEMQKVLQAVESYKAENAQLKAQVEELKKKPADTPAHEKFRSADGGSVLPEATGDKGLDRLARRLNRK